MKVISLAELADGGGALELDRDGHPDPPAVAVDLDGSDPRDLARASLSLKRSRSAVVVGVSSTSLPEATNPLLKLLTCTLAPAGPGVAWAGTPADLAGIDQTVNAAPWASVTLAGLLAATSRADVLDGLLLESLAYSTLLASPEFAAWLSATPGGDVPSGDEPVLLERHGNRLSIVLNRPDRHNAFGRAVRDGLIGGLRIAEVDPSISEVVVSGNGRSFCSGGDLAEFGSTPNVATGHMVRLRHSAGYAMHRIAGRVRVVVHGACIGAGIEIPAFAGRVEAKDDSSFRLPELGMGLVPGAGGTVSITRRIGRWRTAYLALVNRPVDVETALAWGLVDARA